MSTKDKMIKRFKSELGGFTVSDIETILGYCGYKRSNKGKTSGSRIIFVSDEYPAILIHKPHPQKEIPAYQIRQIREVLEQEGLI